MLTKFSIRSCAKGFVWGTKSESYACTVPCSVKINTLKQSRVTSRTRSQSLSFFYWRRATLVQIYKNKFWGAPPKITPHFLDFLKKSATQKTRFFPVGRNFGHRFLKKTPNSSIFGVPDPENFFPQNFDKKTSTHQKFRSGPSPSTFYGLFSKKRFSDFHFFSYFFLGNYNQILFIFHKKSNFQRFSGEITKEIWKMKIWKTFFRK